MIEISLLCIKKLETAGNILRVYEPHSSNSSSNPITNPDSDTVETDTVTSMTGNDKPKVTPSNLLQLLGLVLMYL